MKHYQHTQIGYVDIVLLTVIWLLVVYVTPVEEFSLIPFIILAVCFWLFSTLRVESDQQTLKVWFGPGLIRKTFRLSEIASCRMVKNPWYYGWGIRLTPHGWLFNVSGVDAVEFQMITGQQFRIGTDEPEKLLAALERSLGK